MTLVFVDTAAPMVKKGNSLPPASDYEYSRQIVLAFADDDELRAHVAYGSNPLPPPPPPPIDHSTKTSTGARRRRSSRPTAVSWMVVRGCELLCE